MCHNSLPPSLRKLSISYISNFLGHGDIALDCTLGNGHDAELLSDLVGEAGQVHGFDIQEQALANSRALLQGRNNVFLYLAGHEKLDQCLPKELLGRVKAAMFNLGYLPGSSKQVVTNPQTTMAALLLLEEWLAKGGGISLHIYTGHPGGAAEADVILNWASSLPWSKWQVASYQLLNKQMNREILLLLGKK